VLDIGTGSGCLAVATAHHWPEVLVDATDVSRAALEVAALNIARHGVGDRVRLHEADLFPPSTDRYRVILSNPPYVAERDLPSLPPEYAHEPRLALAGGTTGFGPTERIVRGALERLEPDGCLFVEVGAGAEVFATAHRELPLVWLEFDRGGDGVFMVTAADLEEFLQKG
jgi:ribosomal protein L3 glutamine methyltransferase